MMYVDGGFIKKKVFVLKELRNETFTSGEETLD